MSSETLPLINCQLNYRQREKKFKCVVHICTFIIILHFLAENILLPFYLDTIGVQYALHLILWILNLISYFLFYLGSMISFKLEKEKSVKISNYPVVDILIPRYKESLNILQETLDSVLKLDYPNYNVYVLDDGGENDIKLLCEELQVTYIKRNERIHKKAGNLNNVLPILTGEYLIVFDCDMAPEKNFINELLPHIIDEKEIAFVQTPQIFRNNNLNSDFFNMKSSVFNKIILNSHNGIKTTPYIGTNALWRREAIDDIGGFYEGFATEDIATSLLVHDKGWKSLYVHKKLCYGLCPPSVPDAFDQRIRWVIGSYQVLFYLRPFWRSGLNIWQKLSYTHVTGYGLYAFIYLYQTILIIVWLILLIVDDDAYNVDNRVLALYQTSFLSYFLFFLLLPEVTLRGKLRSLQMFFCYIPVYLMSFFITVLNLRFQSTIKKDNDIRRFHFLYIFHYVTFFTLLGLSIAVIVIRHGDLFVLHYTIMATILVVTSISFFPIVKSHF